MQKAVLKVIHRDMSTFILSLFEILYDIRYFLFVLCVFILMFGDMLHLAGTCCCFYCNPVLLFIRSHAVYPSVVNKDDGEFCLRDDLEDPTNDFCDSMMMERYLRVYVSSPVCDEDFLSNGF